MRLHAVVLAFLACTSHGRGHLKSQGSASQAGLFGQVGAPTSRDSLASLLLVRGGKSEVEDVRGGYVEPRGEFGRRGKARFDGVRGGYAELPPTTPSRPRAALRTRRAAEVTELDGFMDAARGHATDIGAVSGSHRLGRESTDRVRGSMTQSDTALLQGGSLKTWSYPSSFVERLQIVLSTDGRPLDAEVQLWQGLDNKKCKMRVYSEDGRARPFSAIIATPDVGVKTIAVRSVGHIQLPLVAHVTARDVDEPVYYFRDTSILVHGGSLRTFDFDTSVENVEIMLKTDGRPLNARIELLQGPNNIKQIIELRNEDGLDRPFFAILDTMPWHGIGSGNAVRIVNTAPIEFPMTVSVQPHSNKKILTIDHVIGGGISVY